MKKTISVIAAVLTLGSMAAWAQDDRLSQIIRERQEREAAGGGQAQVGSGSYQANRQLLQQSQALRLQNGAAWAQVQKNRSDAVNAQLQRNQQWRTQEQQDDQRLAEERQRENMLHQSMLHH